MLRKLVVLHGVNKRVSSTSTRWFTAAAATSRQKRALNPDQLKGESGTEATTVSTPVASGVGSGSSSSTLASGGSNSNLIPIAAAVGILGAGGSYYYFNYVQKDEITPSPQEVASADKDTKEEEVVPAVAAKEETQQEAPKTVEEKPFPNVQEEVTATEVQEDHVQAVAGNRVISIAVPPKMKNVGASSITVSSHPPNGHRVLMTVQTPPPIDDTEQTEKSIEQLRSAVKEQATEALVQSHQSLWSTMDLSFEDLESLSIAQLKTRVVQLAMELRERTKWEAVRLKEFLAMKEKETTEKFMEVLQKQRIEYEDLLAKRLREQENELLTQLQKAVQEKDNSIQSVIQAALEAQENEHNEDKRVYQETKAAELESTISEEYNKKLEEYKISIAEELRHKASTLQQLNEKIQLIEAALHASQSSKEGSVKAHRLSAAALALSEKLETSQSASAELLALKAAAGPEGVIATALSTIPPTVKDGVPTLSELQARFATVYKKSRQAALVPSGRLGLEGQLAGVLLSTIKYSPDPEEAAPEDDQNNADYVLSRARKHVQLGELERAVEELEKLQGQPALTVKDWKKAAQSRIAVEKALKVIKMECALLNESLAEPFKS